MHTYPSFGLHYPARQAVFYSIVSLVALGCSDAATSSPVVAGGGVLSVGSGGEMTGGQVTGGSTVTGGAVASGGDEELDGEPVSGGVAWTGGAQASGGDLAGVTGGAGATGGGLGGGGQPGSGGDGGTGGEAMPMTGECPGAAQVNFALVGWATEAGGTTGGKGGATVTVKSGAELVAALKAKDPDTPLTILVDGTITEQSAGVSKIDIKDMRDVSIIGVGSAADFDGIGVKVTRAGNVVLRNLKIHNVRSGDKDAIGIEGPADHVWVDHCELYAQLDGVDKDFYDGLLDAKRDAEYLTYSWNYLHDSWKAGLAGSSESDTHDRKLTMHHNRIEHCNSRLPLFRGGQAHVFNNDYLDVQSSAINSRLGACVRVEANHFTDVQNPWVSAYSDVLGGVDLRCNRVTGSSGFTFGSGDTNEPPSCDSNVPYRYSDVINHVDEVPAIVRANAGVGKLQDATDF